VVSGGGRLEALLGAGVVHIKMPVYSKNPFRVVVCAFRLSRFAAREKVSILHAHSRVPAWICRIAKKMTPGVKFIYTAHARYGTLNSGLLPIGGADAVICVSEAVREYLASWLPGDASRTRVVYNPLPRAVLPWTGSGDARKKHLLFVGRISAKKDPATLRKAMSFHRDKAWELDIAGDGPLAPYLRKLIAELRLEGRVNALGFRDDVPELITRCDLFLFPSLDEEGLAVSLCEALAAGAPTIASDIAATRELTSPDGKNCGELLPVGDIAAWSEAIGRFLDGTFVPSLGIAVKIPTADEMADEILKIYDEAEREK
jgi:glycosyltransferase involved in cell wall biosynthesis